MKKRTIIFLAIFIVILFLLFFVGYLSHWNTAEDTGSVDVYFCPEENCSFVWNSYLDDGDGGSIVCALYDIDDQVMISRLQGQTVALDKGVYDDICPESCGDTWYRVDSAGLMHNKFCIINDSIVITGSTNPTQNGFHLNRNNLLVIRSSKIAHGYLGEFSYLVEDDIFSHRHSSPVLLHDVEHHDDVLIDYHFCPNDNCEQHVTDILSEAQRSIYFMTFSFTSDVIGDLLIKKDNDALLVQGLFDPTQISKYSEYPKMSQAGLSTKKYHGTGKLHHKVFIVDDSYVITGSYNPTNNGNTRNNENLLIIRSSRIAQLYRNTFLSLWQNS